MPTICLMVRENHKMVREMSGKRQGILWGLMAGHPAHCLHLAVCHGSEQYFIFVVHMTGNRSRVDYLIFVEAE